MRIGRQVEFLVQHHSPVARRVQSPMAGRIVATPEVGGLHHGYDYVAE